MIREALRSAPNYGKFSARDLVEARPYIEVPSAGWAARRPTDAIGDAVANHRRLPVVTARDKACESSVDTYRQTIGPR